MTPLVIAVAIGAGALGALARYGISRGIQRTRASLPWAVFIVNVLGSAIAGIAVVAAAMSGEPGIRYIVLSGFAGGLTTFGTLGLETVQLIMAGRWRVAIGSVLGNLAAGIAAFALAYGAATALITAA